MPSTAFVPISIRSGHAHWAHLREGSRVLRDPDRLAGDLLRAVVPAGGVETIVFLRLLEIAGERGPFLGPEPRADALEVVFDAIAAHPGFVMEADEGRVANALLGRTIRLRALFRPEPGGHGRTESPGAE